MFKRQIFYIASIIFIVLGLVYYAVCVQQPYMGLELEKVNGQWLVTFSDPHGEGYRSNIRVGDNILEVNGEDPGEYRSLQKWGLIEGANSIEFRSQGQINAQRIIKEKQIDLFTLLCDTLLVILGFIFWVLGFITWYKRPFLEQARTLFWLLWLFGLAIVLAQPSSRCLFLAKELEYITFSLAPVFLISFFSVFPTKNQKRINTFSQKTVTVLFVIIIILTVLQALGLVHLASLIRKVALSNMLIGIFISLWNLGQTMRLPKHRPERNEAGIILLGMVIGFSPSVLLIALPIVVELQRQFYTQICYIFVAAVPISLSYVIVNKYLPDSRRLYETIITNFIAGALISTIALYILYLIKIVKTINVELYLASFLISIMFVACFHFIRIAINKLLRKLGFLYKKQGFEQRIVEIKENITSLFAEDWILEEMVEKLGIDGAFIIVENAQTGCLKKAVGRFKENHKEQSELEDYFHKNQKLDLEAKVLPDDCLAEIYVPFISHNSTCGIFFGHRYSHIKFEKSELSFLTLLAGQLAYQLLMLLIIGDLTKEIDFLTKRSGNSQRRNQDLQGITNSLFRTLEQKRKDMAAELYDGPLQAGLDLSRWLKCLEKEGLTDDKTLQVIAHMRELVEDLNYELGLIIHDLRPPILNDLGLIAAIKLLCKEIMRKELVLISLETVGISFNNRFKEEIELIAYRFLQEGIMNSMRHSGSNKQTVRLELTGARLELSVSDAGRGFDIGQLDDGLSKGTHFGLVVMKERIESLGGELRVDSEIQRGTTIKASIPVI